MGDRYRAQCNTGAGAGGPRVSEEEDPAGNADPLWRQRQGAERGRVVRDAGYRRRPDRRCVVGSERIHRNCEGSKMTTWVNVLIMLHVLMALVIIGLVLLQHGKGADMGS